MNKTIWAVVVLLSFFSEADAAANAEAKRNLQILQTTRECVDCDLSGLDLTRMDLSQTNLRGANLSFSTCNLTSFAHADLRGARLHGAVLNGADMEGTDLRGVDFRGVAMESVFLGDALIDDRLSGGSSPVGIPPVQVAPPKPASTPPFIPAGGKKRIVNASAFAATTGARGKKALPSPPKVVVDGLATAVEPLPEPVFIAVSKRKRRITGKLGAAGEVATIHALHRKKIILAPSGQRGKAAASAVADSAFDPAQTRPGLQKSPQSPKPLAPVAVAKPILSPQNEGQTIKKPPVPPQGMLGGSPVAVEEGAESLDGFVLVAGKSADNTENPQLAQLLKTKKCYGCDLAGLDLSGQSLVGADLESANLTGCNLQGCDLSRANLKGAKLVQAKMQQAKIDGADCYKANLSFANLTGASTSGADFDYARLKGVVGLERE